MNEINGAKKRYVLGLQLKFRKVFQLESSEDCNFDLESSKLGEISAVIRPSSC